jgi:hypothetical protein
MMGRDGAYLYRICTHALAPLTTRVRRPGRDPAARLDADQACGTTAGPPGEGTNDLRQNLCVPMDREWAIAEIDRFLALTALPHDWHLQDTARRAGSENDIVHAATAVTKIATRVMPGWNSGPRSALGFDRWDRLVEVAPLVRAEIVREEEIAEKLGDAAPQIDASRLHSWVWDGARSLWMSRHYRDAVTAAARKVNAETQNKVGRRDVSEVKLYNEVFSLEEPALKRARLRIVPKDDGKTFENIHRGARAFADGLFTAIRNPLSHDDGDELDEAQALEQLAAFSVLARWVDRAEVDSVG